MMLTQEPQSFVVPRSEAEREEIGRGGGGRERMLVCRTNFAGEILTPAHLNQALPRIPSK